MTQAVLDDFCSAVECDSRVLIPLHAVQVWENLQEKARVNPIASNMGGSYLTMFSKGGLIFGVINVIGNFGTVFNDQVCLLHRALCSCQCISALEVQCNNEPSFSFVASLHRQRCQVAGAARAG